MAEELEPPLLSLIMAPFRLVKRFFRGLLGRLPITDYKLRRYERDKEEFESETTGLLITSKEVERTIREFEKDEKD